MLIAYFRWGGKGELIEPRLVNSSMPRSYTPLGLARWLGTYPPCAEIVAVLKAHPYELHQALERYSVSINLTGFCLPLFYEGLPAGIFDMLCRAKAIAFNARDDLVHGQCLLRAIVDIRLHNDGDTFDDFSDVMFVLCHHSYGGDPDGELEACLLEIIRECISTGTRVSNMVGRDVFRVICRLDKGADYLMVPNPRQFIIDWIFDSAYSAHHAGACALWLEEMPRTWLKISFVSRLKLHLALTRLMFNGFDDEAFTLATKFTDWDSCESEIPLDGRTLYQFYSGTRAGLHRFETRLFPPLWSCVRVGSAELFVRLVEAGQTFGTFLSPETRGAFAFKPSDASDKEWYDPIGHAIRNPHGPAMISLLVLLGFSLRDGPDIRSCLSVEQEPSLEFDFTDDHKALMSASADLGTAIVGRSNAHATEIVKGRFCTLGERARETITSVNPGVSFTKLVCWPLLNATGLGYWRRFERRLPRILQELYTFFVCMSRLECIPRELNYVVAHFLFERPGLMHVHK